MNYVKEIYAPFTEEEISDKIAEMVRDKHLNAEVKVVFQSVENLHVACPNDTGDWYFTGNYPLPGVIRWLTPLISTGWKGGMKGLIDFRAY